MQKTAVFLAVSLLFVTSTYAGPTISSTTVIELRDNKDTAVSIAFLGVSGTTWTYEVTEVSGRDLSHWNLGIPCVLDDVESWDPTSGFDLGVDGSTGFLGIKWDVPENFSSGRFSFTLGTDAEVGEVPALVKAGRDFAVGFVPGPSCGSCPGPCPGPCPSVPAPSALLLASVGTYFVGYLRKRKTL